jgi:hypothetical protein
MTTLVRAAMLVLIPAPVFGHEASLHRGTPVEGEADAGIRQYDR